MRLVRVIKDGETEAKLVEFTSIKADYTFFVKGCPVVCGEDAHISEDADYDGALLYDEEGEGYFPEDLDALEHPKVGFQSLQRLLCGERCKVATYGGMMRFLVTGSYMGISKHEATKARQNHMAVDFFPDGSGDIRYQTLVPWDAPDHVLEEFCERILCYMEEVAMEGTTDDCGCCLTSSSWHAGHADNSMDALMLDEDQQVLRDNAPRRIIDDV